MDNVLIEKDKTNSPFLLASSFCGLIKFVGSYSQDGVIYWQFSPKNKAQTLLNKFYTKTEPHIPARDLFEAIEVFWKQVSELRDGRIKYAKAK